MAMMRSAPAPHVAITSHRRLHRRGSRREWMLVRTTHPAAASAFVQSMTATFALHLTRLMHAAAMLLFLSFVNNVAVFPTIDNLAAASLVLHLVPSLHSPTP